MSSVEKLRARFLPKRDLWHPDHSLELVVPSQRKDFDADGLARYLELIGVETPGEFCRVDQVYYARRTPRRIDRHLSERHFMEIGWRMGLDPHGWFDTKRYLSTYADVAESGANPFEHFLIHGWREHRVPTLRRQRDRGRWTPARMRPEFDIFGFSKHLQRLYPTTPLEDLCRVDETYYRENQTSKLEEGESAEIHFHEHGWVGFHNPNRYFDTRHYLENNDDVREAGIDPFEHYLLHGWREGRRPAADLKAVRLVDLITRRSEPDPLNLGFNAPDGPVQMSGESLGNLLRANREPVRRLVIGFGHDNYRRHVGGIQMVAGIEQRMFDQLGFDYLYVYPTHHRLALAPASEYLVEFILNGVELQARTTVADLFDQLGDSEAVVIHSLYGHSPEAIAAEIPRSQPKRLVWWIHDYSIHCENHLLAHNDSKFCGDPPPESQLCAVCTYGGRRAEWLRRVGQLRASFDWEFLTPSQAAAEIVTSGHTALDHAPRVIPHGCVTFDSERAVHSSSDERLRIGFVGHPNGPKGWHVFCRLVDASKRRGDPIDFLHFGATPAPHPHIGFVQTRQTIETLGLTTRLLKQEQVDAVVVWSTHRETFNIVTQEAIAAGCHIICPTVSGNIAMSATTLGRSILYTDEDELISDDSFNERIRRAIGRKVAHGEFRYAGTTAALFGEVRL